MFTISKENLDETRIEKLPPHAPDWENVDIIGANKAASEVQDPGATQRVFVSGNQVSTTPPARKTSPQPQQRRNYSRTNEQRASAAAARKKKERITIITLCSVVAVLLIAAIIVITSTVGSTNDNGLILKNVFAAGVDLSGMTQDQAKNALQQATYNTYSQLDMVVNVLDSTVKLSPKDTAARLNIDAVVKAAYEFGRTGSSSERQQAKKMLETSTYAIPLDNYLTLNTGYIRDAVKKIGKTYSTTLSQPTCTIQGERPTTTPDPENIDLTYVHQTLYIQMGTAEYGLNTDRLYRQIMDAYSQNLFQVTGECSVIAPEAPDCDAIFAEYCVAPKNATMDHNYVVTPETYGYGIKLDDLKEQVAAAKYGETLVIPMCYIEPDVTQENINKDLFTDVLSGSQSPISLNPDWNVNMEIACGILNKDGGWVIESGEEFSFNEALGEPTEKLGYKNVELYVGKAKIKVVGGGLSQVASTLYNCALIADLEILERHAHTYAPDFVDAGLDAEVYYGTMDLRFLNNTDHPIRIEASIVDGFLNIRMIGTDTKEYSVNVAYEITKTKHPGTEYISMYADNPGNLQDGDIFAEGITGYDVSTYMYTYDKETGREISKELISESSYARRNKQIIKIVENLPEIDDPTESTPDTEETSSPEDNEDTDF